MNSCGLLWKSWEQTHSAFPQFPLSLHSQARCTRRFVVCPCRTDWAARDWQPAGVLSNQQSAPRPMGESARPLAERSVGKNAERVSHELGAREPSISTAGVCRHQSSLDLPWRCLVSSTLSYSDDSSVITSDIADQWGFLTFRDRSRLRIFFLNSWSAVVPTSCSNCRCSPKRN